MGRERKGRRTLYGTLLYSLYVGGEEWKPKWDAVSYCLVVAL